MRAWRVETLGEPGDVLRLLEGLSPPDPGPGEVSISVRAAALNFADALACRGTYQEKAPLPFTPGMEAAGLVVACGEDVTGLVPGARVVVLAKPGCGAFAEQTIAAAHDVFPIPDTMAFETAAAMPVIYQTAWVALVHRARLQAGETLLVHAGAGGAGSAAIQVGRALGARVVATAGGADKLEVCRELGAQHVVDYRDDDFVAMVNDLTGGRGADVVYDGVGGDTFDRSTKCIAFQGRIVVIGFSGGRVAEARTNHAMVKNYDVVGVNWGAYRSRAPEVLVAAHRQLMAWFATGAVAPLVSEVLVMEQLPAAMDRLAQRATVGKVVLTTDVRSS